MPELDFRLYTLWVHIVVASPDVPAWAKQGLHLSWIMQQQCQFNRI